MSRCLSSTVKLLLTDQVDFDFRLALFDEQVFNFANEQKTQFMELNQKVYFPIFRDFVR